MKAALVVLAACGAAPAEPLPPVTPIDHAVPGAPLAAIAAARPVEPDVEKLLPDPSEELRWPLALSTHPVLEPRFPIAARLAEPGITWQELCARGAARRTIPSQRELVSYLGAWCRVLDHDGVGAVGELVRLRDTGVLGMAEAIPLDIADILADAGDADAAERVLTDDRAVEPDLLDALAATYYEVSRPADAAEINRVAIEADHAPTLATRCHRLARAIVIGDPAERAARVNELRGTVAGQVVPDPTCDRLDDTVGCWASPGRTWCHYFLAARGLPEADGDLFEAYLDWPSAASDTARWQRIAEAATAAADVAGAQELATVALEAALATSQCRQASLEMIERLATFAHSSDLVLAVRTIRRAPDCGPALEPWVAKLGAR
ncbi:MAG TPA: hypothetical protein VLX92_22370 [Kofleriaceae bacterium]|nr:hypothetical protein [Kofleriaceae bacterium]